VAIHSVEKIDDLVAIRTVLASVFDKAGLDTFIPELLEIVPDAFILSTGGTYAAIREILGSRADRNLKQVSEYTGQPEMEGGLVKTLDFKLYLGLLSETYNPAHAEDLKRTNAVPIDMVVANLYPFAKTVSRQDATAEAARGNIDIGGPCLVRAAAKNWIRVAAVTNPSDYGGVVTELKDRSGRLCMETRWALARKAFSMTAGYDTAIAEYLARTSFPKAVAHYRIEGDRA
jgi:phosphoribosylaminoimidazolecarboxamide formyltransferase/IMP cyclohydrolase